MSQATATILTVGLLSATMLLLVWSQARSKADPSPKRMMAVWAIVALVGLAVWLIARTQMHP